MSLYDPAHCLRSRTLLRDTLLKDQFLRDDCNSSTASLPLPATMALASPPSTPYRAPASSDYSPSRPRHHYQSVSNSPSSPPMRPTTRPERHRATTDSYSSPTSSPRRPHTATHTRDHSRSPLSNTDHHAQPHPHLITPHEQVLRTRLERVLFSAGVADDTSKRRERDRGRARSPSAGAGFGATTSANGSTRTVKRTRANTDSTTPLPAPSSSHFLRLAASSPSSKHPSRSASLVRQKTRTSTGRSIGSASGSTSGSGSGKRSATGTTPPLVPDDEDHDEGREPRLLLLTPPATPSPPGYGFYQPGEWGYESRCYRNTGHDEDEDDDEDAESCSSYSSYREGSSISSSALHSSGVYTTHQHPLQLRTPTSPQSRMSPHSPHTPLRPFNARRASVQCRAMDGYVSFANVEGLGVPPDEPPTPHPHSQEKGAKGVLTALGWGGGVVRKILGGGVEKAEDGPGGVVY